MTRELFLCFLMVGCGSNSADDEGGTDATTNDSPSGSDSGQKDGTVADTGTDSGSQDSGSQDAGMDAAPGDAAPDGPNGGQCGSANDCKLFSSYCQQNPCVCIPLPKNQPNPSCMGKMVTCFVDPCLNKMPACDAGTCVVGP
jgi:hypothetical protein